MFWLTFFVIVIYVAVSGAVLKRRIERQECKLQIRVELLGIIEQSSELLMTVRLEDQASSEKLLELKRGLEERLRQIDRVEQHYGQSLAKHQTELDPVLLNNLNQARASLNAALDHLRCFVSQLNDESQPK
ncbi:MAG: hypothetical protein V1738_06665 [Patescibacteria group bacterium]